MSSIFIEHIAEAREEDVKRLMGDAYLLFVEFYDTVPSEAIETMMGMPEPDEKFVRVNLRNHPQSVFHDLSDLTARAYDLPPTGKMPLPYVRLYVRYMGAYGMVWDVLQVSDFMVRARREKAQAYRCEELWAEEEEAERLKQQADAG